MRAQVGDPFSCSNDDGMVALILQELLPIFAFLRISDYKQNGRIHPDSSPLSRHTQAKPWQTDRLPILGDETRKHDVSRPLSFCKAREQRPRGRQGLREAGF